MAIAYDDISQNAVGTSNPTSFTNTPIGVPRGIVLFIVQDTGAVDTQTPTYGGVNMTLVSSVDGTGNAEPGVVQGYFLGTGIPSGNQTVSVPNANSRSRGISVYSVTAAADTAVEGFNSLVNTSLEDPSFTITTGAGVETMAFAAIFSGLGTAGNVTAGSGWTKDGLGRSYTGQVDALEHLSAVDAGGDITCAYATTTADDVTMLGIAIKEIATIQQPCNLTNDGMLMKGFSKVRESIWLPNFKPERFKPVYA